MNLRNVIAALASAALLTVVGALHAAAQESVYDKVVASGKIVVGVTSEAPPFGFIDEKGELAGFDIDIARLLAKSIFGDDDPKRIEFVKQGFAARWPNIESGKIDVGIQVTTIQPDRIMRVGFTRPYIDSDFVIVVRADSDIKSLSDLNNEKYTSALLTSPVQKVRADKYFPKAGQVVFDSTAAQFTAVKTNRVDAAQLDTPVARWYVKNNPEIRIIDERISSPVNNAIFMKLGDFKWWQVLDTMVAEMTGGALFDQYADIYEKWFGERPKHAKYFVKQQ
ncbi:transporter substrate-binding domain-containing protein [Mesorhizobium koreense]|uniref:transporter substrate-binding domain-containing protein n=1 Tax=Mesorhizobium koreense TaxID=3074855 RepID=UPI00287B94F6|nr:transporter substrate-binding domain-containing protein [Mesorhizobium sp. WR6]